MTGSFSHSAVGYQLIYKRYKAMTGSFNHSAVGYQLIYETVSFPHQNSKYLTFLHMTLFHYTMFIYVLPQVFSEFDAVLFSFLSYQYRTGYLGQPASLQLSIYKT